jgi:hypothetical protein
MRRSTRARSSRSHALAALAAVFLAVAACGTPGGTSRPGTSIIPGPSGGMTLGPAELRLVLIRELGPLWYCDRDEYPVGRDEQQAAIDAWPEMQSEAEVFRAVAAARGVDVDREVKHEEKLAVYRLWKAALAIPMEPVGNGAYSFAYLAQPAAGAAQGSRTAGVIRPTGEITIEEQAPAGEPVCPICLAQGTLIDTPTGAVPVESLRLGDPIWTVAASGRRVVGSVIAVGSTAASPGHVVVRLVLEDGRSVLASRGHPLADGRLIGDLRPGDAVDGSTVATAVPEPYPFAATFDLVASGGTGVYLSGGIRLGSTLVPE